MDSPLRDMEIITCNHEKFAQGDIGEECLECGLLRSTVDPSLQKESEWEKCQDLKCDCPPFSHKGESRKWEERFDEQFQERNMFEVYRYAGGYDKLAKAILETKGIEVKQFIREMLSNREKEIAEEMIELSKKIESKYPTEYNLEWRAFKDFRNALREKYKIYK